MEKTYRTRVRRDLHSGIIKHLFKAAEPFLDGTALMFNGLALIALYTNADYPATMALFSVPSIYLFLKYIVFERI